MGAAEAGAVCSSNVRDQAIKKNNLPIHEHHRDFRPVFGVRTSTSSALRAVRLGRLGLSDRCRRVDHLWAFPVAGFLDSETSLAFTVLTDTCSKCVFAVFLGFPFFITPAQ